jgi:aminoglycoside phosphotransferase family enzyme/predicted kinase
MCDAEVRLNQRTAPAIYRGVTAVTREADECLALGGRGTPVEWLVEMNRFDNDDLLDRRAATRALDLAVMDPLASAIAAFHQAAAQRRDHGGRDAMRWVVDGNDAGLRQFGSGFLSIEQCARLSGALRAETDRQGSLLDHRRDAGFVRQCHGDLHLRNIVLVHGQPTLFDAVEFNDEIACIDVFYDLAFLLMDLWKRGLPRHANAVFNRYLAETGDVTALPLLPLFLSCRAAIRAKTTATSAAQQGNAPKAGERQNLSREYIVMAERLQQRPSPRVVAIGGHSGSGKSTLAMRLAPEIETAPGAVLLRSDEIRKELCQVPRLSRLGAEGYTDAMSARVYETLAQRAEQIADAGRTVVVDGVFARPGDREAIERIAAARGIPFAGVWLEAPEPVLVARVATRQADPSDADAEVVRKQIAQDAEALTWTSVDASGAPESVWHAVQALLRDP